MIEWDAQGCAKRAAAHRAETTADVYAQIIAEGVRRTVEAIDARLTSNPDRAEGEEEDADDAA
jgi:hypothetical protein